MKPPALRIVPQEGSALDTVALRRLASGDVSALGDLYDRHSEALWAFACRAAGLEEAEDLLQATFLAVVKVAATYDGRADSARSWLHGIMARLIQQRRRSLIRFARALLRMKAAAPVHDAVDTRRSDILRGLERLSPSKRTVLILADVEGYQCEEIALMLHVPVGTVWTRLHYARKELRAFYEEG
jgi:RNA polymerase sigma-70 factor (ECF subfamily)